LIFSSVTTGATNNNTNHTIITDSSLLCSHSLLPFISSKNLIFKFVFTWVNKVRVMRLFRWTAAQAMPSSSSWGFWWLVGKVVVDQFVILESLVFNTNDTKEEKNNFASDRVELLIYSQRILNFLMTNLPSSRVTTSWLWWVEENAVTMIAVTDINFRTIPNSQ